MVLITSKYNTNAYAVKGLTDIEVTLRPDITIKVDREIKTLEDGNALQVYPIMYNKTNYIPIRSVGVFLNKKVSWDVTKNAINVEGDLTKIEGAEKRTETYTTKEKSNIKATLRPDITIKVDGEIQTLKDGNGVVVYPIMYNNTTYIPIRSAGAFLGKDVNWDNSEESVYIGAYLTDIQAVGTRVDFIKLFDNCINPLTGEARTLENLDPYETDRKAACYDSVKLEFPLLIDTDEKGNKNIIYDMYFQESEFPEYSDGSGVKEYYLVIKKNQCSLFYGSKYTSFVTNIHWINYVYQPNDYFEKYVPVARRSTEGVFKDDKLVNMVKNDIFKYVVDMRTGYSFKDIKKVIFEVSDEHGYREFFSVDASQIRTVTN